MQHRMHHLVALLPHNRVMHTRCLCAFLKPTDNNKQNNFGTESLRLDPTFSQFKSARAGAAGIGVVGRSAFQKAQDGAGLQHCAVCTSLLHPWPAFSLWPPCAAQRVLHSTRVFTRAEGLRCRTNTPRALSCDGVADGQAVRPDVWVREGEASCAEQTHQFPSLLSPLNNPFEVLFSKFWTLCKAPLSSCPTTVRLS